jgi:protein-S-isoprenylcysteine O-methyltransferase Ste14
MGAGWRAVMGLLFLLPFFGANAVVSGRIEPFLTWMRPEGRTSGREMGVLAVVLLLLPAGAYVAARPMLAARRIYWASVASAAVLLGVFAVIVIALGEEIYRCQILGMANCD